MRGLLRAWVLVVPLVLAMSLIRWGQLAYFWPAGYHVPTADIASVVVQGFRFDLKVSAVIGFLLLLVLPVSQQKRQVGLVQPLLGELSAQPGMAELLQSLDLRYPTGDPALAHFTVE